MKIFYMQKKLLYVSFFTTFILIIFSAKVFSQDTPYKTDEYCTDCSISPKESTIQYIQKNSNFPTSIKIKLSNNNKQWIETTINQRKPLSFECNNLKYITVETKIENSNKKVLYELTCQSSYDIFWNFQKDMWDVRLVRSER